MCEVLGVPRQDRHRLRGWTYTVSAPRAATGATAQAQAWKNLHDYFADLIESKRRNPQEDLFSHLAHAEEDGDSLTSQELLSMAFLLLFAGLRDHHEPGRGRCLDFVDASTPASRLHD